MAEADVTESIDDTLRSALAGVLARDASAAVDAEIEAAVEPESAPAEDDVPDQSTETPPDVAPAETPAQAVEAPSAWSAEEKAEFAKLPRAVQATVARREQDRERHFTQEAQKIAETRTRFAEIDRVLEPRRRDFAMSGMSEGAALSQLFALNDFATSDPAGFIAWFAQVRGVDLGSLDARPASMEAGEVVPPIIEQRISSLEQRLQAEKSAGAARQIEAFRANGAHPHFDAVRADMGALIQAGAATTLDEAYQKAVWANPQVREKMLADQRSADEAKRMEAAKARAAAARKATGTQPRPNGAGSPGQAQGTWQDTLQAETKRLFRETGT